MKVNWKPLGAVFGLAFATVASAQMMGLSGPNLLPYTPSWSQTFGAAVPSVAAGSFQANYPYPGQCLADPLNVGLFPLLANCAPNTGSFACSGLDGAGVNSSGLNSVS